MQKVKGIDKVRVSLNDGLTILDLTPENTVKLSELRQVIKNNGFVSNEAQLTVRGRVSSANGQPMFNVAGSGEQFVLVGTAPQPGSIVEIGGRIDLTKGRLFVASSKP
jgi:hypothetical protein